MAAVRDKRAQPYAFSHTHRYPDTIYGYSHAHSNPGWHEHPHYGPYAPAELPARGAGHRDRDTVPDPFPEADPPADFDDSTPASG